MVKNVVIVSDAGDAKGGASVAAIASAIALARAGLNVRFFAGTGPFQPPVEPPPNLTAKTFADGIDLVKANVLTRATQSLWNSAAADAFAEFIQDLDRRETVVHVHSFQFQVTASVVRRALDMGFRVAMTSHDYGIACPYGGFYNYNTHAPCGKVGLSLGCVTTLCNESKSVQGKLWHVAKGALQRGRGRIPSGVHHFVFLSEFSRDILAPYLPKGARISLVPNAIDLPKDPPRELEPSAPFLYVGRLTHEKGVELFAKAAQIAGVRAQFAGTGAVEELVRQANPDAELLGWQSPEQVRERLRSARALVFPSRWYEGQPLVVQEAQAMGLPVIASDASAARSAISAGVDGEIFRSNDVDDLVAGLRRLMDDEIAIREGLAAYERYWNDPPTEASHVARTLAMYEQVLA